MLSPMRPIEFIPAPSAEMPDCFLALGQPRAPTLVAIHGISRNAAEIAARFAHHPAFREVNIVAPLFERERFGKYQQLLARRARETPADQAMFALLESLRAQHGLATERFLLFGFSGGAQMAHRLAMLHSHRVDRLCAAAAGWYLLPDPDQPYPYGLGEGCPVTTSASAILDVPTTVIVGNRDTRIDASVRQDPAIVARQGRNRMRRATMWVHDLNQRALDCGKVPLAKLVTMEGGTHDFGGCAIEAGLIDLAADALLI